MATFLRRRARRIVVDVDTQIDLFRAHSDHQVELLRHFRRIMAWARVHHIPVISTALARRPDNAFTRDGRKCLCIEGTAGQQKLPYTILPRHIVFGPENRTDLPRQLFHHYSQAIFQKRTEDPFEQPRADRLLSEVKADEFFVFGMGVAHAIKFTVLGLLSRRKQVYLLTDAVGGRPDRRTGVLALRQMETKGAQFIQTETLAGKSILVGKPRLTIAAAAESPAQ